MKTKQTPDYKDWFANLRDRSAARAIAKRIVRLEAGNFGDVKFFGPVGELRIHVGAGYRVYFTQRGKDLVILLCGGSKSTQSTDLKKARDMEKKL